MAKIQTDIAFKINYDVFDYVKKLLLSFLDGKDSFYLNQRINADSNVIQLLSLQRCCFHLWENNSVI